MKERKEMRLVDAGLGRLGALAQAFSRKKMTKRITAGTLALSMVLTNVGFSALAAPGDAGNSSGNDASAYMEQVADVDTTKSYGEYFPGTSADDASRNTGRVWTDKSVFTQEDAADIIYSVNLEDDEFLEVFSALGSSEAVHVSEGRPLDVVLVMDFSGSMGSTDGADTDLSLESGYNREKENLKGTTRIEKTLDAMNKTIEYVMAQNPWNRVGIAAYGQSGVQLMDLGRFEPTDGSYDADYLQLVPPTVSFTNSHTGKLVTTNTYMQYYGNASAEYIVQISGNVKQLEDSNSWTAASPLSNKVCNYQKDENVSDVPGEKRVSYFTNIQAGLVAGMNLLTSASVTTWKSDYDNQDITRKPVLILMTDGEANHVTTSTGDSSGKAWYLPDYKVGKSAGSGSYAYDLAVLQTLMSASYYKLLVDEKYENLFDICTVLASPDKVSDRSDAILNPGEGFGVLNETEVYGGGKDDPLAKTAVTKAYNNWVSWKAGQTPICDEPANGTGWPSAGSVTIQQLPNGPEYEKRKNALIASNLNYVDEYAEILYGNSGGDFKDRLATVMQDFLAQVSNATTEAFYPTDDIAGALEYVDPVGKYMEVKNFNQLVVNYSGNPADEVSLTIEKDSSSSNTDQYKVTGVTTMATNTAYNKEVDLSNIKIYVDKNRLILQNPRQKRSIS